MTRSWFRTGVRAGVSAAAALGLAAVALVGAAPTQAVVGTCPASPDGRTLTARPGTDLKGLLSSLCAGDTVLFAPGTYAMGDLRLYDDPNRVLGRGGIRRGVAGFPITLAAADPANRPVLQGSLQFTNAFYWNLDHLRIQATVAARAALTMRGGADWKVTYGEFWGARATNAMSNVTIDGSGGYPRRFLFSNNAVHHAAQSTRADATDHNIYVNYQGASGSSGVITRNIIWSHPHGVGIKIGNGGAANALGPWGLTVSFNTIYNGGRQILLHGNVRNNTIYGNILEKSTQRFNADPRTTLIYIHDVTGPYNRFHHNYGFGATMFAYDIKHKAMWGVGNRMYNDAAHNPLLTTVNGQMLYASSAVASWYGAYGTGLWP